LRVDDDDRDEQLSSRGDITSCVEEKKDRDFDGMFCDSETRVVSQTGKEHGPLFEKDEDEETTAND
jgi:hypothetical protein